MQPATRISDLELLTVPEIMSLAKCGRDMAYEIMRACKPIQSKKGGELRCFASEYAAYMRRMQEETRVRNLPATVRGYQRRKAND